MTNSITGTPTLTPTLTPTSVEPVLRQTPASPTVDTPSAPRTQHPGGPALAGESARPAQAMQSPRPTMTRLPDEPPVIRRAQPAGKPEPGVPASHHAPPESKSGLTVDIPPDGDLMRSPQITTPRVMAASPELVAAMHDCVSALKQWAALDSKGAAALDQFGRDLAYAALTGDVRDLLKAAPGMPMGAQAAHGALVRQLTRSQGASIQSSLARARLRHRECADGLSRRQLTLATCEAGSEAAKKLESEIKLLGVLLVPLTQLKKLCETDGHHNLAALRVLQARLQKPVFQKNVPMDVHAALHNLIQVKEQIRLSVIKAQAGSGSLPSS
ncbi:MAG: hypothetical protein AB7P37_07095 [Ramlibacter sp.]